MDATWMNVDCDPKIHGGKPIFAGTDVPVTALFVYLSDGETLEQFLRDYPAVRREQATEVLRSAGEKYVHAATIGLNHSPMPGKPWPPKPKTRVQKLMARLKRLRKGV